MMEKNSQDDGATFYFKDPDWTFNVSNDAIILGRWLTLFVKIQFMAHISCIDGE